MKAVIQRVSGGSVRTEGKFEKIGRGYTILLGVSQDDSEEDASYLAEKIAYMRIFSDDGKDSSG